ncbi:MAG TPA: DUF3667 domain-containing protein [Chryseosolibacter sp.]|nr:DUF3667 domain-containing protein [Chryseosolibacter sp.]
MHELNHALTHTDKGFLLLMKDLVLRPGHVAKEYIEGKRKKYFNPLTFLVITSAIAAYLSYKAGYYQAFIGPNGKAHRVYMESMELMIENSKLFELILIFPLIALFSWILFRRKTYNFAENAVLAAFILGEMNLVKVCIGLPLFLLSGLSVQTIDKVFHVIILVYFVIAFRQFFQQNIFITIIKTVLLTLGYIAGYWIAIISFVMIKNLILH